MDRKQILVVVCAIASGVLVAASWLPAGVKLDFTPDSAEYEAIAINLRTGQGYRSVGGNIAINRSPLYPALLAALYSESTETWHQRIIWCHQALAFIVGFSLVVYARSVFGTTGLIFGMLAAILVSQDDELTYAGSQVLTELPATALLTVSMLVGHWAIRGTAGRELWMAAVQSALFMTRSAMVLCGVSYGLFLVYHAATFRPKDGTRRVLCFGIPCAIVVCTWSAFLWAYTGQFVMLTSTGISNMASGMDPEYVARLNGLPIPQTTPELEAFWTAAPGTTTSVAFETVRSAASQPLRTLRLTSQKLKIAFDRLPTGVFYLAVCGISLQLCAHLKEAAEATKSSGFSSLRLFLGKGAYFLAGCCSILAICGYSHPVQKAIAVALSIAIIALGVSPTGHSYASRDRGHSLPPVLVMVYCGLILMILISFGLPRFTRPFLPAIYLSATLCIPLWCHLVNTTRNAQPHGD